jgi:hypothetical protein
LCGTLPIRVSKSAAGQPEFRFVNADDRKNARVYRLMQTVVRRVREGDEQGKAQATGKSRAKGH